MLDSSLLRRFGALRLIAFGHDAAVAVAATSIAARAALSDGSSPCCVSVSKLTASGRDAAAAVSAPPAFRFGGLTSRRPLLMLIASDCDIAIAAIAIAARAYLLGGSLYSIVTSL